jgi:alkanesulfonate monooxygenase SsuD/methylene tetrahydromethanopterin reductase-like flavin-dependent oxidoreductase (luciferase family)
VLAHCATVAEATASRRDWRALAQKHGRDPEGLRFIVRVMPILAESEQAALKRAAKLDGLAGVDGQRAGVSRVVGTPDQFADWLAQWHVAGACDGFDILPAVLPVDLDLVVEAVVPQLRQRGLRRAGYDHPTLRGHLGLQRAPSRFAA